MSVEDFENAESKFEGIVKKHKTLASVLKQVSADVSQSAGSIESMYSLCAFTNHFQNATNASLKDSGTNRFLSGLSKSRSNASSGSIGASADMKYKSVFTDFLNTYAIFLHDFMANEPYLDSSMGTIESFTLECFSNLVVNVELLAGHFGAHKSIVHLYSELTLKYKAQTVLPVHIALVVDLYEAGQELSSNLSEKLDKLSIPTISSRLPKSVTQLYECMVKFYYCLGILNARSLRLAASYTSFLRLMKLLDINSEKKQIPAQDSGFIPRMERGTESMRNVLKIQNQFYVDASEIAKSKSHRATGSAADNNRNKVRTSHAARVRSLLGSKRRDEERDDHYDEGNMADYDFDDLDDLQMSRNITGHKTPQKEPKDDTRTVFVHDYKLAEYFLLVNYLLFPWGQLEKEESISKSLFMSVLSAWKNALSYDNERKKDDLIMSVFARKLPDFVTNLNKNSITKNCAKLKQALFAKYISEFVLVRFSCYKKVSLNAVCEELNLEYTSKGLVIDTFWRFIDANSQDFGEESQSRLLGKVLITNSSDNLRLNENGYIVFMKSGAQPIEKLVCAEFEAMERSSKLFKSIQS